MTKNNEKILKQVKKNNGHIIDDHTGKETKIIGLVEFNNPDKGLGCMFNAPYYSINEIYYDGEIHCSTLSIGGVLWGVPSPEELTEYNESQIYDGAKIKCCHMLDGTTIYPTNNKTEERKMKDMNKRNAQVVEAMRKNNGRIIDNHTDKVDHIIGLVEFNNPDKGLACMFNAKYYSLNAALYIKGEIHCSQASIGGVLWGCPDSQQLKKYNDNQIYDGSKIKCCHMLDGTTVYPLNMDIIK